MKNRKRLKSATFLPENRKGDLLPEEVLKLVIAVICIGFLVYLFTAIYFTLTSAPKLKEAEASKNIILEEISRVNSGEESNFSGLFVPNPSGWFIFSFVEGELKPNTCVDENCLCICEEAVPAWFDWQEKRCDEKGSCIGVSNLKKFEKIKIETNGIWISINKINNQIEINKKQ
jgi:hypothetical protein